MKGAPETDLTKSLLKMDVADLRREILKSGLFEIELKGARVLWLVSCQDPFLGNGLLL